MSAPNASLLQTRSLPAGSRTAIDAPAHPGAGILRKYILRFSGTLTPGAAKATFTYRDFVAAMGSFITAAAIQAPRYNTRLCSNNLTFEDWARIHHEKYGKGTPVELGDKPLAPGQGTYNLTAAAHAFQADIVIPFEEPRLGSDKLWPCPPASLFRGDFSASVDVGQLTQTITLPDSASTALTVANLSVRLLAVTSFGNDARVPVRQSFEKKNYAVDSIDVGRGIFACLLDLRAASESVQYELFKDGKNQNGNAVSGEDLLSVYMSEVGGELAEPVDYVPLAYISRGCTVNDLAVATNGLSVKFTGANSGHVVQNVWESPDETVKNNVARALGVSGQTMAAPITPNNSPIGQVVKRVALSGPRTLLDGNGASTGSLETIPTVPDTRAAGAFAAQLKA